MFVGGPHERAEIAGVFAGCSGAHRANAAAMQDTLARSTVRALLVIGIVCTSAAAATAQVSVPANYPTIQAAIDAVSAGALPDGITISVQKGVYQEALVVANAAIVQPCAALAVRM